MIDTHCHLDASEFDGDREAVLQRARDNGVRGIVVPAIGAINFEVVGALCRSHHDCHAAYGIHPMYVDHAEPEDLDVLRECLRQGDAIAVGEIGLDRFVLERDDAKQEYFYSEQLKIARDMGFPVLLHVRRAVDQVLKHLRRIEVKGGIAHAFNGSRQQADEFIKLGFKLGFGGAMTWQRALHLRELAAALPLESIVLETDAPDIPPQWVGKGRNEPSHLKGIAAEFAALRDLSVEEVVRISTRNALDVLPGLSRALSGA